MTFNLSVLFRNSNILGLYEPEMVGDLSNKERERGIVAIILCTDKNYLCSCTITAVPSPDERGVVVQIHSGVPICIVKEVGLEAAIL
jgi:hypothetical protein